MAAVLPPQKTPGAACEMQVRAVPSTPATAAEQRLAAVRAGARELGLWLRDLMRGGLNTIHGQSFNFWENIAARMIDAQAPALARALRRLSSITSIGETWPEIVLEQLARLHLLVEGFERYDMLPPELQTDLRTAVGWLPDKAELAQMPGVVDSWLVLGRQAETNALHGSAEANTAPSHPPFFENPHHVFRTWFYGLNTRRVALIQHTARASPVGMPTLTPETPPMHLAGLCLDAEFAFLPGSYPLQAMLKLRHEGPLRYRPPLEAGIGYGSLSEALEAWAGALACTPWLDPFPFLLRAVLPARHHEAWVVVDTHSDGCLVPLAPRFERGWHLLALSSGEPVSLFGEWDGGHLMPLCAWTGERFVAFRV